ncbi:hypothetical protein AB4072_08780 [Microvirga sp. 2MCAF38]|uniref:hypothetical protein n=1 Tax=Microvirga sp. 2MCAF38 TaxID=3232989 RepID=UPI003F951F3A
MADWIKDDDIRLAVVRLLEEKGYTVTNTASGSGVPRYSRVIVEKGREKLACAIKTTTGGRISFTRAPDGSYFVLSDADRVIHACRSQDEPSKVRISMFDKSTVLDAFEANHKAKVERGREHIPSWVNPEYEDGWRLTGSGFQEKALWSETVEVSGSKAANSATSTSSAALAEPSHEPGIMERVKAMLAEHMGVQPELIEIDVRVKL